MYYILFMYMYYVAVIDCNRHSSTNVTGWRGGAAGSLAGSQVPPSDWVTIWVVLHLLNVSSWISIEFSGFYPQSCQWINYTTAPQVSIKRVWWAVTCDGQAFKMNTRSNEDKVIRIKDETGTRTYPRFLSLQSNKWIPVVRLVLYKHIG